VTGAAVTSCAVTSAAVTSRAVKKLPEIFHREPRHQRAAVSVITVKLVTSVRQ
jgi:hypothetical protein